MGVMFFGPGMVTVCWEPKVGKALKGRCVKVFIGSCNQLFPLECQREMSSKPHEICLK